MQKQIGSFILAMILAHASGSARAEGAAARLQGATQTIALGETARFPIASSSTRSTELHARCDLVSGGGSASLIFDGDHYVPLSDPEVGAAIAIDSTTPRHFDLTGTIEANKGDAYIAFYFASAPQTMCFPGMSCDGKEKVAAKIDVTCQDATP
ncbi:MAG: hypothetical protein WBN97_05275 [Parvibaculum sp.]|jgi:hypothetical protein